MPIDPIIGSSGGIIIHQSDLDAHSLQAMIELVYVQTANGVLADSMASLDNALTVTQKVMNTLTGLQNLHNYISAPGKTPFNFNYKTGNVSTYQKQASAYFNTPVSAVFTAPDGTIMNQNSPEFTQFTSDITTLQNNLIAQIQQLSAITPSQNGALDPNSLLSKCKDVLKDLTTNNVTTFTGAQKWVLDNYTNLTTTSSSSAGQIQQRLTFAVTAGQSLNDTQKETVQRYLFLFEEYYKSASAVLTKISQLIERMGQSISR